MTATTDKRQHKTVGTIAVSAFVNKKKETDISENILL
jgi:hypothetical protein